MARETIVEKKSICDMCGVEMYTNQKTGEPWTGVEFIIYRRIFFGLFACRYLQIDLCKSCYCKLTGKKESEIW